MKTLVAGWFSFDRGAATAGDLLACELTCEWLEGIGCDYDLALAPPFCGGVNWRRVDPKSYAQVIFVCGPFQDYSLEMEFLQHFAGCRLIGLNLTMPVPLEQWNPFDLLIERDSTRTANPDISFLSRQPPVPVVGVCLVEPYLNASDAVANAAIQRLIAAREMSVVLIDTRLDNNITGLRTPAEVESLIARMDVMITTRLHGTVLALKNGVPVISIDPEAGGAKIVRQCNTVGWDVVFAADSVTDAQLQLAFDYCLSEPARVKARKCRERAIASVEQLRETFQKAIAESSHIDTTTAKQDPAWKTRICTNNKNCLNLETYPHSYAYQQEEQTNNSQLLLQSIARRTLPMSLRRSLKTLWRKHSVVK